MKQIVMFAAMLAAVGMVAGCFTSAAAYTKKTLVDGTVTESRVSVIGTGDKASQVAAEGLFADGDVDDLGAGVKTANASQQSTGIDGSISAIVQLAGVLAPYIVGAQTGGIATPAIASNSKQSSASQNPYSFTAATTTFADGGSLADVGSIGAAVIPTQTVLADASKGEVVILGNRSTCSLCRSLWASISSESLSAALGGVSVIDADAGINAAVYAARRPMSAFSYPLVRVYANGSLVGEFSGRGLTQASFVSKVNALIKINE